MRKLYFDLKKYHDSLQREDISTYLKFLLEDSDKKLNGKEVVFCGDVAEWGILVEDRTLVRRDWCSRRKSKFNTWAENIGDRIKEFQEMR